MTSKPQDTTTPASQAADAAAPDANRRLLLGAGLVGIAAILAQACSGSNFSSASKSKANSAKPASAGDDDDDDVTGGGTDPNKDPLIMTVGATKTVKDLLPAGTKVVSGTSDDPKVATYDPKSGVITAIGPGTAVITISTAEGDKKIYVQVKEGSGKTGGNTSGGTGGTIGGATGGLQGALDTGVEACFANTVTTLNLSAVPDAEAASKPKVVCYGTKNSLMVCVKFSGNIDLQELVITLPGSGKLLALHGITGADKNDSGWRPIVIDNLMVGDAASIVLVLQLGDKSSKKFEVPLDDSTFKRTFQGKPVVDLSAGSVPAGFTGKQALAVFADASNFQEDQNTQYPNLPNSAARFLETAQAGATWTLSPGFMNIDTTKCVFTDIMGEVLASMNGSTILEHQVFVVYYMDGSAYRTMLQVG